MNPKEFTVCIGIISKNVSTTIEEVLNNAKRYGDCFKEAWYVVVDGHSTDLTIPFLIRWVVEDKIHHNWMTQTLKPENGRTDGLVEARNMVLKYFRPMFGNRTILLLLDADNPNTGLFDIQSFMTCFDRDDWAGVFVNQPSKYYDVWALRDEICQDDWQKQWVIGTNADDILRQYEQPKARSLKFWPVRSAFGGAGMYRTHLIPADAKYEGRDKTGRFICEHVPFNEAITNHGGKLFINCEWMNNDH